MISFHFNGQQWSLPRHCQRGSHRSVPQLVQGPYSDTSASTCLSCLRSWDDGSHFQSSSLFLGSKLPKCYSRNPSFNFQNLSLFRDFSECHWRRSSAIEGPNRHAKSLCDRQWQLKVLKAAWCLALTLTQQCCQANLFIWTVYHLTGEGCSDERWTWYPEFCFYKRKRNHQCDIMEHTNAKMEILMGPRNKTTMEVLSAQFSGLWSAASRDSRLNSPATTWMHAEGHHVIKNHRNMKTT